MGSVGINGEDESQPGTSNFKKHRLPKTLLVGCDGGNNASVPRKLRSAIKKQARKSITSPLSISKKQSRVSNKSDTRQKDSGNNSKQKMDYITKDEEEVAEILYGLASIFSGTNKANKPTSLKLLNGQEEDAIQDTGIQTQREEAKETTSKFTLEIARHSPNLSRSKGKLVKLQSCNGVKTPEVLNYNFSPWPEVTSESLIDLEQVTASEYQYGDKCNSSFQSQSAHRSSLRNRIPVRLKRPVIDDKITTKNSWKRSSAHVYISHLIKALQVSENKEESSENSSTPLSTYDGPHQVLGQNGMLGDATFSGTIHAAAYKGPPKIEHDLFLSKRFIHDHQLALKTSALCSGKEGFYDFLSLGTEICSLETSMDANKAGNSHGGSKQIPVPHVQQSQSYFGSPISPSRNGFLSKFDGHSSAVIAQEVQTPQYLCDSAVSFTNMKLQQQWSVLYNNRGAVPTHLPKGKSGSEGSVSSANCAQALFPHLLGSIGQQFSPQTSSSLLLQNVKKINLHHHQRHDHQFPLGFLQRKKGRHLF